MNRTILSAALLAALLVLSGAEGQTRVATAARDPGDAAQPGGLRSGPDASQASLPEQATPSDDDLKTFAEIYAELQEADDKFEHDMASARTEEQARAVTDERDRTSSEALRAHGWTRRKFDEVAAAINSDPALVERAIELLEEDT
ncbi:MAG TPA: DUF4168 domain-containing protein [Gammaproteobacteria bacterium]|nr:DUF4168 domain-containing protein [Gammaproteobacteria bacterium]